MGRLQSAKRATISLYRGDRCCTGANHRSERRQTPIPTECVSSTTRSGERRRFWATWSAPISVRKGFGGVMTYDGQSRKQSRLSMDERPQLARLFVDYGCFGFKRYLARSRKL